MKRTGPHLHVIWLQQHTAAGRPERLKSEQEVLEGRGRRWKPLVGHGCGPGVAGKSKIARNYSETPVATERIRAAGSKMVQEIIVLHQPGAE